MPNNPGAIAQTSHLTRAAVAVIVMILAEPVLASHVEPLKAKKATFNLINAYFPCTSPNTAMQSNGGPACAPVTTQPCALSSGGSGKLSLTHVGSVANGDQDIKVSATVTGLNSVCEGDQLVVFLSYRLTSDDCPEGSCTESDVTEYSLSAFCVVAGGKCKIKGTLRTSGGQIPADKNGGIEILGCGLKSRFPLITPPSLACGVLLE